MGRHTFRSGDFYKFVHTSTSRSFLLMKVNVEKIIPKLMPDGLRFVGGFLEVEHRCSNFAGATKFPDRLISIRCATLLPVVKKPVV